MVVCSYRTILYFAECQEKYFVHTHVKSVNLKNTGMTFASNRYEKSEPASVIRWILAFSKARVLKGFGLETVVIMEVCYLCTSTLLNGNMLYISSFIYKKISDIRILCICNIAPQSHIKIVI